MRQPRLYASMMYRKRTSAQTFTSAYQTENYDSDDLRRLANLRPSPQLMRRKTLIQMAGSLWRKVYKD